MDFAFGCIFSHFNYASIQKFMHLTQKFRRSRVENFGVAEKHFIWKYLDLCRYA